MAKLFCFFWEEAPLNQSRPSTTSFLAQGTLVVCEEFSGCGTPDTRHTGILIGLNKNHSRHAPSGIHIHGPQHVCRYSGGGPCQTARCFGLLSASTRESKDWSTMTIKINARVIWRHDIKHILQTYIIYLEKQKMKPHFVKIKTAWSKIWKGGNHPKGFNVWWFWGVTLRYGHRPPGEPPNIRFKRWTFMIGIGTVVCSMQP